MKVEQLTTSDERVSDLGADQSAPMAVGQTVFEKLAVDAKEATRQPFDGEELRFLASVTRLGDGQTVPDER
jgi:hypothetical protein